MTRPRRLRVPTLIACTLLLLLAAAPARAEIIVGPGAVAGPVNVSVEGTTIVGSTTVTSGGANNGTNVTGNTLTLDSLLGPSPGAILVQVQNGNALMANGGNIGASNSVSVLTQNGHGMLASNVASVINANGTSVQTTGTGAGLAAIGGTVNATNVVVNNLGNSTPTVSAGHGAIAESAGTVTVNSGSSIATGAFNAVGLGASGANSQVIATAIVPVTMNGRGAMGIYLNDGGAVSLPANAALTLNASNGVGVSADNTTSTIASGLSLSFNAVPTAGQASGTGLVAFNTGALTAPSVVVQGVGAGAGAWARPGSSVTLTGNSSIAINAAANPTYYTLQTAFLITSSGSVGSIFGVTSGLPIGGLLSNGGTITSTGTLVNVSSVNGVGAYAGFNSAVSTIGLVNNTITTTGTNSYGIEAGENGRITGSNSLVTTSGGGAALFAAAFNTGYGSIELGDSTVQANGADTSGFASVNLSDTLTTTLKLTGSSLASEQDAALYASGGPVVVTMIGASADGGSLLLDAVANAFAPQATSITVNASGASTLDGDARADATSAANLALATGSHWTGTAIAVTGVDVDASSRWSVTGNSVVRATLANAGTTAFTPPGGGALRTLTTRDYAGGGALGLYTLVAGDGAPSDRLVVDGGAVTGTTTIQVTNTTGAGALTTGNGILVVEARGGTTTTPTSFTLAAPLVVGGYEYALVRGSVDASGPENWYLRSTRSAIGVPAVGVPASSPAALVLAALAIVVLARRRVSVRGRRPR